MINGSQAILGRPERLLAGYLSFCLMLRNMLDIYMIYARYLTFRDTIEYT